MLLDENPFPDSRGDLLRVRVSQLVDGRRGRRVQNGSLPPLPGTFVRVSVSVCLN